MGVTVHPDRIYLPLARKHALHHTDWLQGIYSDYWIVADGAAPVASTGFTFTSLTATAGTAGKLNDKVAVATAAQIGTDASADAIIGPAIFGDNAHAVAAAIATGQSPLRIPPKLILEIYGGFSTSSANEPRSGFGLLEDDGTSGVAADQAIWISVGAANYVISTAGGTATISTVVVDALPHLFKIVLDNRLTNNGGRWFIDNVEQTALGMEAAELTVFPARFHMHALTTNRPFLNWAHIYYSW